MFAEYVRDAVHEETQHRETAFDLTVAEVYEVVEPGRVDFGGGELEAASLVGHDRHRRNPDDDYEWWSLSAGQYLLEYNESLSGDVRVTVQPRTELLELGASHPTMTVSDLPRVPLSVGGAGVEIKENARVSTLVAAEE